MMTTALTAMPMKMTTLDARFRENFIKRIYPKDVDLSIDIHSAGAPVKEGAL